MEARLVYNPNNMQYPVNLELLSKDTVSSYSGETTKFVELATQIASKLGESADVLTARLNGFGEKISFFPRIDPVTGERAIDSVSGLYRYSNTKSGRSGNFDTSWIVVNP